MKIRRAFFVFLAMFPAIVFESPALAQGTAFTYQGRLNDGGAPANGTNYSMVFYVYGSSSGGNSLGSIGIASVAVSNGLFTVPLTFGSIFDGNARWLELTVEKTGPGGDSGFTTLAPRQPITLAPYAMFANTASNLVNGGANLTSLDAGNISGGTLADARLSPDVALRAGGNTFTEPQFYNGPIYLNSTNGFDQSSVGNFFVDAPYVPGGRLAVLENGNVGVGISSPQFRLDVNGGLNLATPATIYSAGTPMLRADTAGNVFNGPGAGSLLPGGLDNTALGYQALRSISGGSYNTAIGYGAMASNTNGSFNTANGLWSLEYNTSGSQNIALGYQAGYFITTGNNNIDIGNQGVSTDSGVIRIGSGQTQTFIAGTVIGMNASNLNVSSSMTVTGEVRLGVNGTNYAPRALESMRLVRGLIATYPVTPRIDVGTGFTVVKNGTGDYTINFDPVFNASPVVTVSLILGPTTDEKAFIYAEAYNYVEVRIYNNSGTQVDPGYISFIAAGN